MKSKKKNKSKLSSIIILALAGAGVGFLIGKLGAEAASSLSKTAIITGVLFFVPLFFLAVAFHEAGHALAGVMVKFEFKMYVVGPFLWEKGETGWTFKWNKNVNTSGGMVLCLPVGNHNLKNRFSIYSAGGPLASFLLAGLTYLLATALTASDISYLLMVLALLSIALFVATIIPLHLGGFTSDGGRIWNLQAGGDKSIFELLLLKIIMSSMAGIRPSALDAEELEEAVRLSKKINAPFGVYLHSYFHQLTWDAGNVDAAEKHLQDYIDEIDSIPPGIQNAVWLDAAFFYAYAKRDLEKANSYWNQFKPAALIPKAQIFATEASLYALKNDRESSLKKIDEAIIQIPNMIDRGIGIALSDKLASLRNQLI